MERPNENCQQAFGDYKLPLTLTEALSPNSTLNSQELNLYELKLTESLNSKLNNQAKNVNQANFMIRNV